MPFQKGVSGNPKGRPKKEREAEFARILFSEVTPDDFREMVATAKRKAKQGEYQFMKLLFDYLVGPPVERKEVTGADGSALQIVIIDESDSDGQNSETT